MMSLKLQVGIIVCMILVALYIVNLMRKKRIDFKYALGWLFIDIIIVILAASPKLLEKVAGVVGIADPTNMLFFFGLCLAIFVIFSLSMYVSKLSDQVRKLSQEIAIIRKDMYDNYQSIKEDK